jgi:ketosteroid isomerase-like protein
MSSANVDLVRSIYAASGRGDFTSVEWAHLDIEFVAVDGPDPGSWTVLAQVAKAWSGWLAAFADYRVEPEEYRELVGEGVLVLMHHGGRGKTSGLAVEQLRTKGANLFHVRDGKVAKLAIYWRRERAFADVTDPSGARCARLGTPPNG